MTRKFLTLALLPVAAAAGAGIWATQADGAASIAGVLKLVGVGSGKPAPAAKVNAAPAPRTVRVVAPMAVQGTDTLTLSGRTAPAEQALLSSRASGIVAERRVDIGDKVQAGDVLIVIEAPEIEQELRRARAAVDQAKAREALAKVNLERAESLVGKGHTSIQTVDERRAAELIAKADVAAAAAEVKRLEEVRSFQTIRAPFDGTIVARHVERGDKVSGEAGQQSGYLLRIARLDELRIEIDVPQSSSLVVKPGAAAKVQFAEVPEELSARVVRVAGQIDQASSTMRAELLMANPDGRIPAGLNGQVMIDVAVAGDAVTVPANTLMTRSGKQVVAVVDDKTRVEIRHVRVVQDLGERVVIAAGLTVNDRVIVSPNALLRPGDEVQITALSARANAAGERAAK